MKLRRVILTGGSRGIGKCLKELLVARGHPLVNFTRSPCSSEDVLMDLTDHQSVFRGLEKVNDFISTDDYIFVNNAACLYPVRPLGATSASEILDSIHTNISSPLLIFNFFEKLRRPWHLINITSGAAYTVNQHLGLYSTSKAFMERFLVFLREENSYCKTITSYDPGICNTKMHEILSSSSYFQNASFASAVPKDPGDVARDLVKKLEGKDLI